MIHYMANILQKLNFKKKSCLKKTSKKFQSSDSFFFFSFSVCIFANSNSSLVCLNFFNLSLHGNFNIKTQHFDVILVTRNYQYPIE